MALFTETIETEQLWSRKAMGELWSVRKNLDGKLVNQLDVLFKSRQKDSVVGKTTIKYTLGGKDSVPGKLGFGRLYSRGFETFENEARGSLCSDFYYDVDVKNAHPTLMYQFAKKLFDYDMVECKKFCANRQQYYEEIADNKEEAKAGMFRVLYGGACNFSSLVPFKTECESLANKLMKHTDYCKLWEAVVKAKEQNPAGSFLSYVLQTEERKVMLCMRDFFIEKGWSVDVLCYDGIMVRKLTTKDVDASVLREAEGVVLEKTGYKIELDIKPFTKYSFSEADLQANKEIVAGLPLSVWEPLKTEWEKTHFYFTETNSYAEVREDGSLFFMDKDHARTYFHNNFYYKLSSNYNDVLPLFNVWLNDTQKRVVDQIDFAPTDNPKVYVRPLNWAHLSQEQSCDAKQIVDAFLDLVAVNTSRNQTHTDYVVNYIAHLLQRPFELPRVALLFIGGQGAGKDLLWEFLGSQVLGEAYYHDYETNEQFFAPHDTGRQEKFLVKLQEADPTFCRKHASTLKGLITAPKHTFNPKGKTEFTRKNYMRLVLTTNKGNPLELEQSDRRWLPFVNTNELITDKGKLQTILKFFSAKGAGKAVADYLLSLDLGDFTPFNNRPTIEYKQTIQEAEKTPEERFVEQWDGEEVGASTLYNMYRDYCLDNSLRYCDNALTFGKRLLILIATNKLKKIQKNKGAFYKK